MDGFLFPHPGRNGDGAESRDLEPTSAPTPYSAIERTLATGMRPTRTVPSWTVTGAFTR